MAPRLNIPPLTRSLFVSLIALTFLNATIQPGFSLLSPFVPTDRGSPYLTIVPGISWTYPWTFVTATLVEQNVFGLAVTGLTLFFGGRYLERAYGSSEYAKYMLVTALIPNFFCFAFYIFLNEAFGSGKALYVRYVSGQYVESCVTNRYLFSAQPQFPVPSPPKPRSSSPSNSSFPNTLSQWPEA